MRKQSIQRCHHAMVWVVTLAIASLPTAIMADEPGQTILDPGFRPDSDYAGEFVANAPNAEILVLPTLIRREGRTAHSFASQRQIVAFLNDSGIARASARNRRIDLGPLRRPSQWEIFEYGLLRIAENLEGYGTGADYTLVMELLIPNDRDVFGIEVYVLDTHGENAFSFLLNSHHRMFADAKLKANDSSEAARKKMNERATAVALKALEAQISQQRTCTEKTMNLVVPKSSPGTLHDFETPPRSVRGVDGFSLGFSTFSHGQSRVSISRPESPPVLASETAGNGVMQLSLDVTGWAGVVYLNPDATRQEWGPRDWSDLAGLSFWFYGNNSGTAMFFDVLDNRRPCSRREDAERYTYEFWDDAPGWRQIHIRFEDMARKEIGNGALNDGLNLDEVHGWGLGATDTGGPRDFYVDDLRLWTQAPDDVVADAERIQHRYFLELRLSESISRLVVDPARFEGLAVEQIMTLACECARLTIDRGFRYYRMDERARFAGGRGSFRLTFLNDLPAGMPVALDMLVEGNTDGRKLMTAALDAREFAAACEMPGIPGVSSRRGQE